MRRRIVLGAGFQLRQTCGVISGSGLYEWLRLMSAMMYAWGQFIDHDLDLTGAASPAQPFNIQVPAGDPSFDPGNTGTQVIPLNRSAFDPNTVSCSGVYCHGNGSKLASDTNFQVRTPVWTGGTSQAFCGACVPLITRDSGYKFPFWFQQE